MREWLVARIQGRPAAPVWQNGLDLIKLFRVQAMPRPDPTSWVFAAAPMVTFGCYLLLALATPPFDMPFAPLDLISIVYLLGLGRYMLGLSGMDNGTPWGGMSVSREMFVNTVTEPILLLAVLGLSQVPVALSTATTDVQKLMDTCVLLPRPYEVNLPLVLTLGVVGTILLVLALVMLLEVGLLPFDNPASHLEVPMIQEGPLLEYSGRKLALLEWAKAMRLTFFLTLLTGLIFRGTSPSNLCIVTSALPIDLTMLHGVFGHLGTAIQPLWFVVKMLLGIGLLVFFEVSRSRMALARFTVPAVAGMLLAIGAIFVTVNALWGGFR